MVNSIGKEPEQMMLNALNPGKSEPSFLKETFDNNTESFNNIKERLGNIGETFKNNLRNRNR